MKSRAYLLGKTTGVIGKYLHLKIDADKEILITVPLAMRKGVVRATQDEPVVYAECYFDKNDHHVILENLRILWTATQRNEYEGYLIKGDKVIPPTINNLEF